MTLSPGQTLASYEILALLGKGGMGEVYRARDANLDREVAIKVLPDAVADDEERVLRFQREAKVLASLAHAHIGAIHGFESVGSTRFLVLEYVEGESLGDRLSRGPLSIEEALETCRQIAEALEAAHESGVVHRDLKPANVQLKANGTVKVLDFGLARAMAEESGDSAVADTPTITADFTRPGVVLGTAPYMSPEQARGKTVDKRADIWAFGCCLYECLTGGQAFNGETITDLFADIIKGEPDWKRLPRETPWKVRELLERCLVKDPSLRLRDMGDARIELRRLSTETGSLTPAAEVTAAPTPRRPGRLGAFALGFSVLGAALFAGVSSLLREPVTRPLRYLAVDLSDDVPTDFLGQPMLSPDGSRLLFQAAGEGGCRSRSWFLHEFSTGETRPVTNLPPGSDRAFLSRDGSTMGFLEESAFMEADLDGGPVRKIAGTLASEVIAGRSDWDESGGILFASGEPSSLYSLRPGETDPRLLYTTDDPTLLLANPICLPGGRAVLLTLSSTAPAIGVLDLESLELKRIIEGATSPLYVRSGHLLYVQDAALMATRFDLETLEVGAERRRVPIESLEVGFQGDAWYSVSRDEGTLVYLPGREVNLLESFGSAARFTWLGDQDPVLEGVGMGLDFDISPDSRWLAVSTFTADQRGPLPATEIRLYDLQNPEKPTSRLAHGFLQVSLHFSPDGSKLAYAESRGGSMAIFAIPVLDHPLDPQPLLERDGNQIPHSWIRDPEALLFSDGISEEDRDVMRIALGKDEPEGVLETRYIEEFPTLSPDGTVLAFVANLDGQAPNALDLYIQRYPPTGPSERITNTGATGPRWLLDQDGLRLFYTVGGMQPLGAGGALHSVAVTDSNGDIEWGNHELHSPDTTTWRLERVAGDGRILVMEGLGNPGTMIPKSPEAGDHFVYVANFLDWLEQAER